ncbi:MAG: carboxypeptidase-like regulatory domain-containing protein [Phycisphaeraceae bacterium]
MTRHRPARLVAFFILCGLLALVFVPGRLAADDDHKDRKDEPARGSIVNYRIQDVRGEDLTDAQVAFRFPIQGITFETTTDANGWASFNWPAEAKGTTLIEVTASKPGYGKTTLATRVAGTRFNRPDNRATWFRMPVPKPDSFDADNALRGKVVGPDGLPVEGVRIIATGIVTPGGRAQTITFPSESAWTDRDGRFSYMPVKHYKNAGFFFGYYPPPNTTYDVGIYPPKDSGLAPYFGSLDNLNEQRIALERSSIQPVFNVDDPLGPDLKRSPRTDAYLPAYELFYSEANGEPEHEVRFLTGEPRPMRPGYYTFRTKTTLYRRIHLTEDSPDEIDLAPHPPTLVTGLVKDPETGAGLANAIVLAISLHDQATIKPGFAKAKDEGFWQDAARLPKQMPQGHASLNDLLSGTSQTIVLKRGRVSTLVQPPTAAARTGADGRFALLMPEGVWHDKLVVLAEDRLPWVHRLGWFPDPSKSHIALPDTPMVKAGLIWRKSPAEPTVDERLKWVVDEPRELPKWAEVLIGAQGKNDGPIFDVAAPRKGTAPQPLVVPAGLPIRLVPYTRNSGFHYEFEHDATMTLEPGKSITLDQPATFHRRARVNVRVIDEAGKHIVGAPIQVYCNTLKDWSEVTNAWHDWEDGTTPFNIDRRTGGIVAIRGEGFPDHRANQVILDPLPDRPGDERYEYPEVVLTITPEQLRTLYGQD